jgi:hypothetical protein
MTQPHRHEPCPECTGHIAVTQGGTVLPDRSHHEAHCDIGAWETQLAKETQP